MTEENKNMGFNKDGHLDENSLSQLAEWLNGNSNDIDPAVEKHLEACMQCKQDVLEISELQKPEQDRTGESRREKFEETCAAKHSPSIKSVSGSQFWRVAAIFAALISITAFALLMRPKNDGPLLANNELVDSASREVQNGEDIFSKDDDSLKELKDKPVIIEAVEEELYAGNFVTNQALDALVGAKFRAGGSPQTEGFPMDTSFVQGSIVKIEISNPKKNKLELQILDNRGKEVKSYKELNGEVRVEWAFDPGLYYWKLLDEDEMFQIGKITLREK